jgi:HSP20 family protein
MLFIKSEEYGEVGSAQDNFWRQQNDTEGYLAIDVYQKPGYLIIRSTIAGASADDIEVLLDDEMLTIKGHRHEPEQVERQDYLYRECYWGKFSRTIILPLAIDEAGIETEFENGVLTIILPEFRLQTELSEND